MNDTRPPALLIAGDPSLDFLNSIGTPADTVVEWLANGEDLMAWLEQAELVPPEVAATICANCFPGELDAVAAQARALREWFRAFVLVHRGHSLGTDSVHELEPLNRILERDDAYWAIVAKPVDGTDQSATAGLERHTLRRWRTPASLLLPIAHAMANFITSEDLSRVKSCEKSPCTFFFLDRTRGQARRWCSMSLCGNRAKQALHRARLKRQKRPAHRDRKAANRGT
ncbi:MAG: CGNR zinc finger domain-containing protein [Candidatus Binataceae bacterium]